MTTNPTPTAAGNPAAYGMSPPVQKTSATFVGMPKFPKAARVELANAQQRRNLRHATHTIRTKRAHVVGEVEDW
jgi:L-lactate dehydrogenase complex protein LldF